MEILRHGPIRSIDKFLDFVLRFNEVIVPRNDGLDITHFWVIRSHGVEKLYVGTPDTFDTYVREESGIQ